jgi:hypothetical protein
VYVGKLLHDRLDQQKIYLWCYSLLAVAGLKLLFDAIRSFL